MPDRLEPAEWRPVSFGPVFDDTQLNRAIEQLDLILQDENLEEQFYLDLSVILGKLRKGGITSELATEVLRRLTGPAPLPFALMRHTIPADSDGSEPEILLRSSRELWYGWLSAHRMNRLGAACANPSEQREGDDNSGLKPSREKAYRLFEWATGQQSGLKTDRQVYDWLKDRPDAGEELPSFPTWAKYLREARAFYDDRKHTPRTAKHVSGRSIARRDQV